jgi:hypothetical protein
MFKRFPRFENDKNGVFGHSCYLSCYQQEFTFNGGAHPSYLRKEQFPAASHLREF